MVVMVVGEEDVVALMVMEGMVMDVEEVMVVDDWRN